MRNVGKGAFFANTIAGRKIVGRFTDVSFVRTVSHPMFFCDLTEIHTRVRASPFRVSGNFIDLVGEARRDMHETTIMDSQYLTRERVRLEMMEEYKVEGTPHVNAKFSEIGWIRFPDATIHEIAPYITGFLL